MEFFEHTTREDFAERLATGTRPDELDPDGWTPLHHAAVHGKGDLVEMLVKAESGQRKDGFEWTPLHCVVAAAGEPGAISRRLDAGADIAARTGRGIAPLHFAARLQSFAIFCNHRQPRFAMESAKLQN
ncbi:MAG: ankyrin repeat domain-containing protein [Albidovulum sp.]|nr:ankyrin repeat domain-containing protein [Albidovulum sp.]